MSEAVVEGQALPAPGRWVIDPAHTSAGFVARHLMVTKVRGKFTDVAGAITIAERPEDSTVELTLGAASIATGSDQRDAHLRSADFLDVENHKELAFRSTSVKLRGLEGTLEGKLTIRGVTKPVSLVFEYLGAFTDPWGNAKIGFSAKGILVREDWDLNWNVPLEGGGVLVSKTVDLDLEVQANLEQPTQS